MKKLSSVIILLLMSYTITAQIGINETGANPDPSAGLDVDFTNKGFLMPRVSTVQRDAIQNPANGLMIYNTDSDCIEVYFGTGQWKFVQCGCNAAPNQPIGITGAIDVCLNQTSVNYSVPFQNGVSFYTWSSSEPNDVINGQGTNNISVDFVGAGIRTLFVVANNSCGASDTTSLIVDSDNPNATFTPLIGAINQNVNFVAQTYVGATYSWTFGQGTPATSTSQNPSVTWANQGTYAVSLTITDSVGCSSTALDSISILTCTSGSITFNYTGAPEQWIVPNTCNNYVTVEVWGAEGGGTGSNYWGIGGKGGYSTGNFPTVPGTSLYIVVGQQGFQSSSSNAYNGGGKGNPGSSNGDGMTGGGASHVALSTGTLAQLVSQQSDVIIVAGGGGGAAGSQGSSGFSIYAANGGNGGGLSGTAGTDSNNDSNYRTGGGGGTQSAGGSSNGPSVPASFGRGADSSSSMGDAIQGGGGGGGYYGGGAGATAGGGGGGGSGYIGGVTNGSMQTGVQTGNGKVTITW